MPRSASERLARAAVWAAGAAALLALVRPVSNVDVWFHLAAGRRMALSRAFLGTEVFCGPFLGQPWLNHEWLYQVALYLAYRGAGAGGLLALKVALAAAALAFFAARLRRMAVPAPLAAGAGAALSLGLGLGFSDRPDLVSAAGLCAVLWALETDDGELSVAAAAGLAALALPWANAHGLFILGLLALGQRLAERLARRRPIRRSATALSACAAASLATPNGLSLYTGLLGLKGILDHSAINEFQPAGLGGHPAFWLAAVALWLAVGLAWRADRLGRWTRDLPLCALLTVLAARHQRFIVFFALAAVPDGLAAAWALWGRAAEGAARRLGAAPAAAALAAALAAAGWAASGARGGVDEQLCRAFPEAARFIASQRLLGPFYNDYALGSYWAWRFDGRPPSYIDGRCFAVAGCRPVMDAVRQAQRSPDRWSRLVDEGRFQAALVRYPLPSSVLAPPLFSRYFPRDRWALVYWDDVCLLFLRRTPANAAAIRGREFKSVCPDATETWMLQALGASPALKAAVLAELRRSLSLHPDSWRVHRWLEVAALTK